MNQNKKVNKMPKNDVKESSGNLYADFKYKNPEEMQAKAHFAHEIYVIIKRKKLTQVKVAKLLNLTQPKVSNLINGRLSGFSIERLMKFLNILDYDVDIHLLPKRHKKAHISVSSEPTAPIPMVAKGC